MVCTSFFTTLVYNRIPVLESWEGVSDIYKVTNKNFITNGKFHSSENKLRKETYQSYHRYFILWLNQSNILTVDYIIITSNCLLTFWSGIVDTPVQSFLFS